jgi:glutamate-1-semialdehyde 2,1-aminomutase
MPLLANKLELNFARSKSLQPKAHRLIPGGCHTYAKGDDQFPLLAPGFIARGHGCHVWDVDGNEYIEYGMGCRAVTLGHAFEPVLAAVQAALPNGTNFTRPAPIEVECAEQFVKMIDGTEMVKFVKDGSSATTAAIKLARAVTGRNMVAYCSDHPFYATNDWFIGTTPLDAGIPESTRSLSVGFRYNDFDSVKELFETHRGNIACLIMEPAKYEDPEGDFLHKTKRLCHEHGALFILDEMITGFRWHNGGAQAVYGIKPDLTTFGKALANGFSVSALAGRREYMQLGGLHHDHERVFLLSTTHGAETHSLAAALATMRYYEENPVVETLYRQGDRLATGLKQAIAAYALGNHVKIEGRPCSLVFGTLDRDSQPSQHFRALLMQELIQRGVLGPSFIISYSHSDSDVDFTIDAFASALKVYSDALNFGVENYLVGGPTQTVYRRFNKPTVVS